MKIFFLITPESCGKFAIFMRDDLFFFLETTCALCPCPLAFLYLASRGSVLGKYEVLALASFFLCVLGLGLQSSTPPLLSHYNLYVHLHNIKLTQGVYNLFSNIFRNYKPFQNNLKECGISEFQNALVF